MLYVKQRNENHNKSAVMNNPLDSIIEHIQTKSYTVITIYATLLVTVISIILCSIGFLLLFGTIDLLYLSFAIAMPLILTPIVIVLIVRILKHLNDYKTELADEVEKSRQKDLMLFDQQRFVLMGEMLSSISHQWRQPLNAINLTLLSTKVAYASDQMNEDKLEKAFDIIEENTHYLSNTIDDFRSFFQNKAPKRVMPLKNLLQELNSIISPSMKTNGISFQCSCDKTIVEQLHLATAITQVLLNLISNSKDALKQSDQEEKSIELKISKMTEYLTVDISDNGGGIDSQIKSRIFDPYFTTKDSLKGSGIGLHMSRQIIEKIFGGTITLEDTKAPKTSFHIKLPFSEYCLEKNE